VCICHKNPTNEALRNEVTSDGPTRELTCCIFQIVTAGSMAHALKGRGEVARKARKKVTTTAHNPLRCGLSEELNYGSFSLLLSARTWITSPPIRPLLSCTRAEGIFSFGNIHTTTRLEPLCQSNQSGNTPYLSCTRLKTRGTPARMVGLSAAMSSSRPSTLPPNTPTRAPQRSITVSICSGTRAAGEGETRLLAKLPRQLAQEECTVEQRLLRFLNISGAAFASISVGGWCEVRVSDEKESIHSKATSGLGVPSLGRIEYIQHRKWGMWESKSESRSDRRDCDECRHPSMSPCQRAQKAKDLRLSRRCGPAAGSTGSGPPSRSGTLVAAPKARAQHPQP
jgi:hypothetical protein